MMLRLEPHDSACICPSDVIILSVGELQKKAQVLVRLKEVEQAAWPAGNDVFILS